MMIVAPDTSPRGAGIEGEDESYDFGTGAGFYLNATTDGFKDHYRMYDYVVEVRDCKDGMTLSVVWFVGVVWDCGEQLPDG